MIFNSKFVALSLALIVGIITALSGFYISEISLFYIFITGLTSFLICYVSGYILLELVVFKELKNLYRNIIKLDNLSSKNAIDQINDFSVNKMSAELFSYSEKKNRELKKMKEIESFRRQFLADIAHELKTPVHIAQGFIETLIDGAIDDLEVRDRFLIKTSTALENLEFIIRDLINISHLETGEIKPDFQVIDLVPTIKKIILQLEDKAKSKNKTIQFNHPTKKVFVLVDEYRIGQVISNLLANAINYSGENLSIWINITETDKKYSFAIIDNGIGIDKIHHDKIFNRFYRVDKSRSKDQGGTGLGLAIAKHIVEVHKSELKLESSLGKGAKFYFDLEKK